MNVETKHKIIRNIFITIVFALFGVMFWPFSTAILLASLFAFALHDIVSKLTTIKKINRNTASLLLLLMVLIFLAAPLVFIILTTISTIKEYAAIGLQNTSIYQGTIKLVHELSDYIDTIALKLHIDIAGLPKPTDLLNDYSGSLGTMATNIITKVPQMGLSLFVFFLSLYYFLNESKQVKHFILKFDLISESEINKIIKIIKTSSFRTLIASIVIATVQAFVIALFAYFSGFTDFFLVFIISFVFALIPVIGSAPVSIFLVLISFIQGNNSAGFTMIVALIIASSLDNLIKPFILKSSEDDIHPIVLLLALIGGILVYGAPGILLGPVITQLAFNILSILKSEENSGVKSLNSDL